MRNRISALLLFAALASPIVAVEPPDYKTPGKDWLKGPVQWLMSADEEKEFRKFHTDEERAAFAKEFWAKRDPTPDTPENEYQTIFWLRVEQADKAYRDILRNGSVTDLGRVFILLGPPSSTRKDSRYTYWSYEPSDVNGIKAKLEFSFATVQTGVLLRSPKTFEEYVAAHPETRGIGWKPPQIVQQPAAGELMAAPAKESVEDTSPESQRQIALLDAALTQGGGAVDVRFRVVNDFYAAVDGTTLVVTTLEIAREATHGSGSQALLPFARFAGAGDTKPVNITGELPFVPAPAVDAPAGSFVYQARRNLKPGAYKLVVVVEDKVLKSQTESAVLPVTVPDYGAKKFAMSSVALLSQFRKLEPGLEPDGEKGSGLYTMGAFRLVPRAIPVLQKSDTLTFYYQVYNPGTDTATGKPILEKTYAFFLREGAEWKPFRKPLVQAVSQVELYEIDINSLLIPNQPLPAEFRMEAKVTDKVTGAAVVQEIHFTVR